jgi:UDP-glucose 4-epimerase
MKILITGGAGFIGTNLCHKLLQENHSITVIDDLSTGLEHNLTKEVNLKIGSILDTELVAKLVESSEAVVHLAARGSVPRSIKNPKATHDVNATGTQIVLEAAKNRGAHFIFSSSSSVYGLNTALPKDEQMILKPATPYAASKMAAEGLALSYAITYKLPVTTFRFFNVYGPYQRADHEYAAVIPKWINKCMNNDELIVFGDGEQTRDFTYVDTVTDLITLTINKPIIHPEPINLAYGNKISLNIIVELLRKEFPNLKVRYEDSRSGDIKHSENNPLLINSIFGSIKSNNFDDSLKKTINWMRNYA